MSYSPRPHGSPRPAGARTPPEGYPDPRGSFGEPTGDDGVHELLGWDDHQDEPVGLAGPRTPRPGRHRRARRRWPWALLAVVLLVALLIGAGAFWVDRQVNPAGGPRASLTLNLPGGSISSASSRLASVGVVRTGWLFNLYSRVKGAGSYQAGAYSLRRNDSYPSVIATLRAGPPVERLTVPEGFTLAQIAARVGRLPGHSASGFLAVANSGQVRSPYQPAGSTNLEGLLFPATYSVGLSDSDASILRQMVDRFDQVATTVGLDKATASTGVSPYQAVIVASMVERESKLAADRGKVARVIYNRLAKGMKLQIDSTVIYGLGGDVSDLTTKDLATPTPYNTYLIAGLPPTPIANPGIPSLQAALGPTPGPWLYYVVVSPDGGMAFSSTFAEQQRNEALARARGLG